jgi:hypothetical protein
MDKPTLDRLSQINDDLVEHLNGCSRKKDLDVRTKKQVRLISALQEKSSAVGQIYGDNSMAIETSES